MEILLFIFVLGFLVWVIVLYSRLAAARQALDQQQTRLASATTQLATAQGELKQAQARIESMRPVYELGQQMRDVQEMHRFKAQTQQEIERLRVELAPLQLDQVAQDFGLYEPKYDFGDSTRYKVELEQLRAEQKTLIKVGQAVRCDVAWTSNGSAAQGRKMVKEIMQLMLFAFNGETETLIDKVRFDNVNRVEERIRALFARINQLDGETQSYITQDYLTLKLRELYLVHEYREKKQAELEEQRQIREQMREEERAQRELERAQQDAEREEARYQQALEKARREASEAQGARQAKLQGEVERLTALLAEASSRKERAISQAQLTRSGHVYVISNIGSFGEGVYKIGMTRRLEPMDRVRELGDASVPFSFDVHAIIYTDDAPGLENALHRAFDHRRLNRINTRKEFFRASLEEIRDVVTAHHGEIEFTLAAEASDYRKSQAMQVQPQAGQA